MTAAFVSNHILEIDIFFHIVLFFAYGFNSSFIVLITLSALHQIPILCFGHEVCWVSAPSRTKPAFSALKGRVFRWPPGRPLSGSFQDQIPESVISLDC